MSESDVTLSRGLPETIMPPPPVEWAAELQVALATEVDWRRSALAEVAAAHPRYLDAWAELVDVARDDVEAYAYARVGYHRGLDALRGAGWRGTGYVRWSEPTNSGFLRSLAALARTAREIGEFDESERCVQFLRMLDPSEDRLR